MAIQEWIKTNFQTLTNACDDRNLCIVQANKNATGEDVVLICAVNIKHDDTYDLVPIAQMLEGNPFEEFSIADLDTSEAEQHNSSDFLTSESLYAPELEEKLKAQTVQATVSTTKSANFQTVSTTCDLSEMLTSSHDHLISLLIEDSSVDSEQVKTLLGDTYYLGFKPLDKIHSYALSLKKLAPQEDITLKLDINREHLLAWVKQNRPDLLPQEEPEPTRETKPHVNPETGEPSW
jgi:hypothetical protein